MPDGVPLLRGARQAAAGRRSGRGGKGAALIRYQPIAPVPVVMPWNFPFWQVGHKLHAVNASHGFTEVRWSQQPQKRLHALA
jgi:hypothetical protein